MAADPTLRYLVQPSLDEAEPLDAPQLSASTLSDLRPWRQLGFGAPHSAAFATDESWLVVGTSAGLLYLNLPDLSLLRFDPVGPVQSVLLDPDGASVVTDQSARYAVRDGARLDFQPSGIPADPAAEPWVIASPRATFEARLAVPDSIPVPGIVIQRIDDATALYTDTLTLAAAFSPSERYVALIGIDYQMRLLNMYTSTIQTIDLPLFLSAGFTPDGLRLATSGDRLMLWDVVETRLLDGVAIPLEGGQPYAQRLAFNQAGNVVTVDGAYVQFEATSHSLNAWRINPDLTLTPAWAQMLPCQCLINNDTYRSAVSPVENSAALVDDGTTLAWWQDGAAVYTHTLTAQPRALAFSADGSLIAAGDEASQVQLWTQSSAQPLRTLALDAPAVAVGFSPDGTLVAAKALSGTVNVWDLTGKLVIQIVDEPVSEAVWSKPQSQTMLFSAQNEWLMIPDNGTLRFYDVATGRLLATLDEATETASIGPNRRLVATVQDGVITLWRAP